MFWDKGQTYFPNLTSIVFETWTKHNPTWDITVLTLDNIGNYLPEQKSLILNKNIKVQAKSDIIRLNILNNFGGVWVDATLLCFQPLDSWITDEILRSGTWMYHGHGAKMCGLYGPASWFIISVENSYIIERWTDECNRFIEENDTNYSYFWMDECFKKIYKTDKKFSSLWNNTQFLYADAFGQSHGLCYNGGMFGKSKAFIKKIKIQPPYVLKMWSSWDEKVKEKTNTNGDFAIKIALNNEVLFRHKYKYFRFNVRMLLPYYFKFNIISRLINEFMNKPLEIWAKLRY